MVEKPTELLNKFFTCVIGTSGTTASLSMSGIGEGSLIRALVVGSGYKPPGDGGLSTFLDGQIIESGVGLSINASLLSSSIDEL